MIKNIFGDRKVEILKSFENHWYRMSPTRKTSQLFYIFASFQGDSLKKQAVLQRVASPRNV